MFSSPWAARPLRAGRLRFNLPPPEEKEEEEEPTEKKFKELLFCFSFVVLAILIYIFYFSSSCNFFLLLSVSNMELTWRPSVLPFRLFYFLTITEPGRRRRRRTCFVTSSVPHTRQPTRKKELDNQPKVGKQDTQQYI